MKKNDLEHKNMFDDLPDVLTVQQVRQALGIGRTAVYRLLENQQIRCFMIGNAYKIPKSSLIEFVRQSCEGGVRV